MFHFHKWSDWNIIEKGRVVSKYHSDHKLGTYITQQRYCHKCGKTQIDAQSTESFRYGDPIVFVPETFQNKPKHDKVI